MERYCRVFDTWRNGGVIVALIGVALTVQVGCHATRSGPGSVGDANRADQKIRAEALSFNARLRRDGKPTTFKLEVYQTDTLLGLSGRGYLGKGALRGWLKSDSIKVFFPSTNELLHESMLSMLQGSDCPLALGDLDVLALFANLPDSVPLGPDIDLSTDYSNRKRPKFQIRSRRDGCHWQLDLDYDIQKPGWRIRKFEFSDGRSTTLRGTRDKYRAEARVPVKRFEVALPPGTTRLTL